MSGATNNVSSKLHALRIDLSWSSGIGPDVNSSLFLCDRADRYRGMIWWALFFFFPTGWIEICETCFLRWLECIVWLLCSRGEGMKDAASGVCQILNRTTLHWTDLFFFYFCTTPEQLERYRARTDDRQNDNFTMVSFPAKVNHHKRQDKRDLETQRFGCREPIEATSISSFMWAGTDEADDRSLFS